MPMTDTPAHQLPPASGQNQNDSQNQSGLDPLPFIQQMSQQITLNSGLLVCPATLLPALAVNSWPGQWQASTADGVMQMAFNRRNDLAVCFLANNQTLPASEINALTRLRDLLARRLLVFAAPAHADTLRALGLHCLSDGGQQTVWQFNILDYKQVPDWFNAKFWANPENWDKYRW